MAKAVVVSPCTRTRVGATTLITSLIPTSTPRVISSKVCPCFIKLRSKFGRTPNKVSTWSSMSRCCPDTATTTSVSSFFCSSLTRGHILIASGRVPKTTSNFCKIKPPFIRFYHPMQKHKKKENRKQRQGKTF